MGYPSDTIARIAPSIEADAVRVIDVNGRVAAPGFIDIHTHARRGIEEVPTAPNYVGQGVRTVMEGPDGPSPSWRKWRRGNQNSQARKRNGGLGSFGS